MLKRKQNLLWFFLTMWCIALPAQETTKQQHTFSFHTGYGNMLKGTAGLTNSSKSYERSLSEGVSWDAQYYYRPADIVGIGFLYSGFSSQGSHEEGSDHLYTHYFAPQAGIYCLRTKRFFIRLDAGIGILSYRNYSKVFDKSRRVTATSFATNAGLNATLKITRQWNIEADIQYVASNIHKIYPRYHNETTTVKFRNDPLSVSRLNLSAGVSFNF